MKKTRISLAVATTAILALSACGAGSDGSSDQDRADAPVTGTTAPVTPGTADPEPSTVAPATAAPSTAPATTRPPTSTPTTSRPATVKPSKPATTRPATRKPTATPSATPTKKPTAKPTTKPTSRPAASKGLDARCMTGRAICVDKRTDRLSWVIDGKVRYSTAVRFGSAETPTREGAFKIDFKSRDHVSTIYKTPMPYAMFFSGGQAVHYSADFAANGYNGASHGCVNVRDKPLVQKLFNASRVGDKVIVYRSAK